MTGNLNEEAARLAASADHRRGRCRVAAQYSAVILVMYQEKRFATFRVSVARVNLDVDDYVEVHALYADPNDKCFESGEIAPWNAGHSLCVILRIGI